MARSIFLFLSLVVGSQAFSSSPWPRFTAVNRCSTGLLLSRNNAPEVARRDFLLSSAAFVTTTTASLFTPPAVAATPDAKALIQQVEQTRQKLEPIPELLAAQEWDQVRSILKTPPVNFLWNMGDSKNPIMQLAQATDEFDLIEQKDQVALSLQMCDQLTYDNVFLRKSHSPFARIVDFSPNIIRF